MVSDAISLSRGDRATSRSQMHEHTKTHTLTRTRGSVSGENQFMRSFLFVLPSFGCAALIAAGWISVDLQ